MVEGNILLFFMLELLFCCYLEFPLAGWCYRGVPHARTELTFQLCRILTA